MCGILGIVGPDPAAPDILNGLMALQHRGQDASGVATIDARLHLEKRFGLVRDAFDENDTRHLPGRLGVGHVRYPTVGLGSVNDAQPLALNAPFGIAMVHNGNVTNFSRLRTHLQDEDHRQINTECDVEVVLNIFAEGLARRVDEDFVDACEAAGGEVFDRASGAYSVVAAVHGKGLVAMRDPFGIKPCIYGRRGDTHVIASESCALDALGAEVVRDLRPGEVLVIDLDGNVTSRQARPAQHSPCIFEFVYFARPDSTLDRGHQRPPDPPPDGQAPGPSLVRERGLDRRRRHPGARLRTRPAALSMAQQPGHEATARGWSRTATSAAPSSCPNQGRAGTARVRHKLNADPGLEFDEQGGAARRRLDRPRHDHAGRSDPAGPRRRRQAGDLRLDLLPPLIQHPCVYGIDMSDAHRVRRDAIAATQEVAEYRSAPTR